jgi:putative transposase
MPEFRIPLVTDEYYHVFNRGVARNPTFLSKSDYEQALLTLSYYSFSNLPMKLSRYKELGTDERKRLLSNVHSSTKYVEILSFVLMPNHFHFLLKQNVDKGVSTFISQFTNSYTRYFNTKQKRVGPLFQGAFKAVHIETAEQILHVSRYIHLNPITSFVINEKQLSTYQWSSLPFFLNESQSFINKEPVLAHFSSVKNYETFVLDQIDYAHELHIIKHLTLEEN